MKMRAAIAGAGLMGFWHARAIEHICGEVAAVLDVDGQAAARLAKKFAGTKIFSNPAELFAAQKLDVLHICTPAETHLELAEAALAQGLHVLIEKPMTPAVTETERLYQLADARRLLICPVHQFLFQRGVKNARAALPKIGRLLHFEATFCSAGATVKNARDPNSVISEILPHPLSLMQLFVPGSLQEKGWGTLRSGVGEFRATLTARGVCCSILISMNSRPTTSTLRLLGTAGTIHVDLFHGFCVVESGAVSRWRKIVHPFDLSASTLMNAGRNLATRAITAEPAYPGLRALVASFYTAIFSGTESPIPREDAVAVAAVRDILSGTA